MNSTLLNLLLTAQLAVDVNNPTNVNLTVLNVENRAGSNQMVINRKNDTVLVACTTGAAGNILFYNYKILKTESGENVKVDGEWRYVETRPNGLQWTFVINKDTYKTMLAQCMEDYGNSGRRLEIRTAGQTRTREPAMVPV